MHNFCLSNFSLNRDFGSRTSEVNIDLSNELYLNQFLCQNYSAYHVSPDLWNLTPVKWQPCQRWQVCNLRAWIKNYSFLLLTMIWILETVQDFLIKLDIKPLMHLLEISIFSLNNDLVRLTKIMNNLVKDLKILSFKVIF